MEKEKIEKLDPAKEVALFALVKRLIKETYKQFNSKDRGYNSIELETRDYQIQFIMNGYIDESDNKFYINVRIVMRGLTLGRLNGNQTVKVGSFKLNPNPTPKEISKCAREIFAWIEKELEKV